MTEKELRRLILLNPIDIKLLKKESNALNKKEFTDILYSLSKLNEWKWEYEAICEELERTAPKYCAEDIPF